MALPDKPTHCKQLAVVVDLLASRTPGLQAPEGSSMYFAVDDLFGAAEQGIDCWEGENLSVVEQALDLKVSGALNLWADLKDKVAVLEVPVEVPVDQPELAAAAAVGKRDRMVLAHCDEVALRNLVESLVVEDMIVLLAISVLLGLLFI